MTLVSVVIPAYQAERWIEQAVASCLAQTHHELDVVVLDDGSTDRTPDIVLAIADPRVRLVRSDSNEGLGVVSNRGFAVAHGDLIARLDADDTMLPTRVARQVAYLDAHPEVGLVGTNAFVVEVGLRRPARLHYHFTGRSLHWALYSSCPLLHPTIMVRRQALPPGGYPTGTRYSHDWALFLAMGRTTRLAMLREPGIIYRRHAGAVGVAHVDLQEASARAVFGRHLAEALGRSPRASTIRTWVHPWTAADTEYAAELAELARALAPDRADLGRAAPAWDGPGLARCRRLYVKHLAQMLRAAPRHVALWRHLLPLITRSVGAAALSGIVSP